LQLALVSALAIAGIDVSAARAQVSDDVVRIGVLNDQSGLYADLGGAIGIALIDTILYGRGGIYAEDFRARLLAGDVTAAKAIGLSVADFLNRAPGPPDDATLAVVRPMVERAALALSVNEAWAMLACVAMAGLLLVPMARDRSD